MIDMPSFIAALPEILIAVGALFFLIAAAFSGPRMTRVLGLAVIATFALAFFAMIAPFRFDYLNEGGGVFYAFGKMFVDDGFARFAKTIILGASGMAVLLSWSYFEKQGQERPEYPVLILLATLGMMLMVSANNLLALYVGIELQSLSLYILAAIKRDDPRSSEAGLKYFVLGALSSGILLYGMSLIYGFAGTIEFSALASVLRESGAENMGAIVGMVFVCAALAFKISGVPFHMWAPDVYEGAPTPVTAFFASAPKFAALALFTRFLMIPMEGMAAQWHQIVLFVAIASMLWGAFAGLVQANLKRLLAYSSIANVGYLLVGLLAGGAAGVQAMLVYFSIYALNTLGVFAVIMCLRREGQAFDGIADLSGLSRTNPVLALAMAVLMFSMAGIPPLAGFLGKYFVFLAAVDAGLVHLAVIGVLSSVVAAYYYLRIIKVMYFDEPAFPIDPVPDWGIKTVIGVASSAMVLIVLAPAALVDLALNAAKNFVV